MSESSSNGFILSDLIGVEQQQQKLTAMLPAASVPLSRGAFEIVPGNNILDNNYDHKNM